MESGSIEISERLIKAGADYRELLKVYNNYFKAVHYNLRNYNQFYLDYLINRIKHLEKVSPLILSFEWQLIDILFLFLSKRELLEQINSDGNTLLTLAQKSTNKTTRFAFALYFYWRYRSKEWWEKQSSDNFLCDYCNTSVYKMDTTFLYRNKLACEECCSQRLIIPHKVKMISISGGKMKYQMPSISLRVSKNLSIDSREKRLDSSSYLKLLTKLNTH